MLRVDFVYLKFTRLFLNIKSIPVLRLKAVFLPVILISLFLGGNTFFYPLKAEARAQAVGDGQPSYFQQLEEYGIQVEQYKKEQERLKKVEALNKALVQHTVRPGETLTHIAHAYRVDLESLICWNAIDDPNLIYPGQVLDLLSITGTIHVVRQGDTLKSIAKRYQSQPQAVASFNLLAETSLLTPGERLVIPGGVLPSEERKAVQALLLASRYGLRESLPASPLFDWPVKGRISSHFGWRQDGFHYGLDIAVPQGRVIRAAAEGVVLETGVKRGYGLMLVLKHSGDWRTLYAHCSRLLVGKNQKVAGGQPIALIGATGNATGPHLHLEIAHGEQRYNPLLFLPAGN